jgi:hypothetical protein
MRDTDAESAPRQLRIDDLIQQLTEFASEHGNIPVFSEVRPGHDQYEAVVGLHVSVSVYPETVDGNGNSTGLNPNRITAVLLEVLPEAVMSLRDHQRKAIKSMMQQRGALTMSSRSYGADHEHELSTSAYEGDEELSPEPEPDQEMLDRNDATLLDQVEPTNTEEPDVAEKE